MKYYKYIILLLLISCKNVPQQDVGISNEAVVDTVNASANDTLRVQSMRIYDGLKVDNKVLAAGYKMPNGTSSEVLTADGGKRVITDNATAVSSIKASSTTFSPDASGVITLQKSYTSSTVLIKWANTISDMSCANCYVFRTLDIVTICGYIEFYLVSSFTAGTYFRLATLTNVVAPTDRYTRQGLCSVTPNLNTATNISYMYLEEDNEVYVSTDIPLTAGVKYIVHVFLNFTTNRVMQ